VRFAVCSDTDPSRFIDAGCAALDAECIYGREHIERAVECAERAFRQGRNVASRMEIETVLYAACERNISRAFKKLGVRESTRYVLLLCSDGDVLKEVEEVKFPRSLRALEVMGIPRERAEALSEEERLLLVYEKIALSELLR